MKKTILFGGIGLLTTLIVGFWVYSFLYGSPTNTARDVFTDLGLFGGGDAQAPVSTPEASSTPIVDTKTERLRQLTTKPVIGMRMISTSSTTAMRYVESGTGQVFDIDMKSGTENRISQITVPMASKAEVSSDGKYIAIRAGYTSVSELMLITIKDGTAESLVLPGRIEDFHFSPLNNLQYTEINNGVTEGKEYDPTSRVTKRIFTIPFTAAQVVWSNSTTTPNYVYTKPASNLPGYAYQIKNGSVQRLPFAGSEITLNSDSNNSAILVTVYNDEGMRSVIYNPNTQKNTSITLKALPEKCVFGQNEWFCATNNEISTNEDLTNWYKGVINTDDRIWQTNDLTSATQLIYPKLVSGRSLDITYPTLSQNGRLLYFINKIDSTLWLYE